MATTNLAQTKHTDGRPVAEVDIEVGLTVLAPTMTGGVMEYECVSKNAEKAEFKSLNKDWPIGFEMLFNQPDFTWDEFVALDVVLKSFCMMRKTATTVQDQLVRRAHRLGYARRASYTQATWTEKGVKAYSTLRDNQKHVLVNGHEIQYSPFLEKWKVSHENIGPCGEFPTLGEAVTFAEKG